MTGFFVGRRQKPLPRLRLVLQHKVKAVVAKLLDLLAIPGLSTIRISTCLYRLEGVADHVSCVVRRYKHLLCPCSGSANMVVVLWEKKKGQHPQPLIEFCHSNMLTSEDVKIMDTAPMRRHGLGTHGRF
jgi:hypothetical protein